METDDCCKAISDCIGENKMSEMEIIDTGKLFCGETPVYTERTDSLTWIDTGNPAIYTLHIGTGKISRKELSFTLEGLVPRENGGWIAPTANSILLLNKDFEIEKKLDDILPKTPALAFHDCTAGSDGCLYLGTYDAEDYTRSKGEIFRLNFNLQFKSVINDLALPNGSGFSPDGQIFYVNEMMASRILVFDFDRSSGKFTNRRTLCKISPKTGYPDGMTIDSEGCLWIAHWQGFRISRINPDGKIIEEIKAPVPSPTCMTFGGKDLKTLYITSATKGLSEEQMADYPNSGLLFRAETENKGITSKTFNG